jgi:hypothetical protein
MDLSFPSLFLAAHFDFYTLFFNLVLASCCAFLCPFGVGLSLLLFSLADIFWHGWGLLFPTSLPFSLVVLFW